MRLILIAQTLIILAGAYYIYTLHSVSDLPTNIPLSDQPKEIIVPATTSTPTNKGEPSVVDMPVATGTDAGMEWPTLEL